MRNLRIIVDDIRHGKNIEIYVILVLAATIVVLDIFHIVSFEIIAGSILATLALLAYSLLENRRTTEESSRVMSQLDRQVTQLNDNLREGNKRVADLLFFSNKATIGEDLQHARSVSIVGGSLSSSVKRYAQYESAVKRGCSIRIIVSALTPSIISELAFRSNWAKEPTEVEQSIRSNLARFRALQRTADPHELLEIRTIPFVPAFGLTIMENADGTKKTFVKMLAFRATEHPEFKMDSAVDGEWSHFFSDQFEKLWEAATPMGSKS